MSDDGFCRRMIFRTAGDGATEQRIGVLQIAGQKNVARGTRCKRWWNGKAVEAHVPATRAGSSPPLGRIHGGGMEIINPASSERAVHNDCQNNNTTREELKKTHANSKAAAEFHLEALQSRAEKSLRTKLRG
ncbi:MAG TPA: hypothetical protein VL492_08535 [Methylovirgula sp.]|nr:hypothetical protein [Methylovirgula sp.]